MRAGATTLVVGELEIARRTCAMIEASGHTVVHLFAPTDADLREAIAGGVEAIAVLVRGDVIALRYALLIEHLMPGVRLVVTLFDRTVSDQLVQAVPNCRVMSPADVAVPSIVGACLSEVEVADPIVAVDQHGEQAVVIRNGPAGESVSPWRSRPSRLVSARNAFLSQVRPHDLTTTILLTGFFGLLVLLGADWVIAVTALQEPPARAFFAATRVVATVGPGAADNAPSWYLIFSALSMLLTIGLTALFTAGVLNRLRSSRSVGLIGTRTVPTRDHVVVVGLGQVGLRLCTQLRQLGIAVVAVERDPRAANLRLAKLARVPVLIGHAEDRAVLGKLSLHRARALAAMGADELDNVEVAIAALAVCPEVRIVLRAGESDVIAETRSLFHIGEVRDVSALTALAVTLSLFGQPWQVVYPSGHDLAAFPTSPRSEQLARLTGPTRCSCRSAETSS